MKSRVIPILAVALAPPAVCARPAGIDWNAPFPPHQVMGNLYYVGTEQLASFLVVTPEGHILINSAFESTVPVLQRSVEALGFDFGDIGIVLGSHAEHPIDRVLGDGDTVTLGGTTLTAHRTPGHTQGCTSWGLELEEGGRTYQALIICSFGVNPDYVLVGNPDYPSIADDYVATFARARALSVDVFLTPHGSQYGLAEKYARLASRGAGDPNPFVDRAGYLAHIDAQEARFEAMLEAQRNAAP